MEGLTINEAAETTGWSARMLRYIESAGLIEPARTPKGYRVFGPGELQRLRTLRELLTRSTAPCRTSPSPAGWPRTQSWAAVDRWFEERPEKPDEVSPGDWLSFEQQKHQRLLAADPTPKLTETAA